MPTPDISPCQLCQAPSRMLWGPLRNQPTLARVELGNWIVLETCPSCGVLWCRSPYEPYGAFNYLVHWALSRARWRALHDRDDGKTLSHWHEAKIREYWRTLPSDELDAVENHRRRSYGSNPVDAMDQAPAANLEEIR